MTQSITNIADHFRRMMERLQPAEKAHAPRTDYRGRQIETLPVESIGKPPEPKVRVISFPDLLSGSPEEVARLLGDSRVRVRVHPDQFRELEELVGEGAVPLLGSKFIVDPNTGRKIDRLV